VQFAPPNSTLDKLFASVVYGAVFAIAPPPAIVKDKIFLTIPKHSPIHA